MLFLHILLPTHVELTNIIRVPIYEVLFQATRSPGAATFFVSILAIVLIFTTLAAQQTSLRLIWSFARDDALIYSTYLGHLHDRLDVPVWALLFNWFSVFVLGCVYLASSTAFNAIVAPGLILEQISFAFPSFLLMWQGRNKDVLPSKGPFQPGKFGWVVNFVSVSWALVELVFYSLPTLLPVTAGNMSEWNCQPNLSFLFVRVFFIGIVPGKTDLRA